MPEIFDSARTKTAKPSTATPAVAPQVEGVDLGEDMESNIPLEDTPTVKSSRHVDEYSQVMKQQGAVTNPFHAFAAKPANTFFDSQAAEEKVLLLLRQHPVTQVKWVVIALVLIFVPYLFSFVGFLNFLPVRYQLVAGFGWYLMVVGFCLEAFLNWFYNVYIITDERIIDVDFLSLLFKNISSAKLDKIEDYSATTSGALGAIFDYGSVQIQTAGSVNEFEFENVPHPSKVTAFLNELIVEEEREKLEGRLS